MPKTSLRALSARAIVTAIADAADRWSDADFPPRVRATQTIETRTGYTTPVVEYALDRLFFSLTREALDAAIGDELGSLDALDGFVARRGRPDGFARGVDRVVVVASDTTIGVSLVPAMFALCAKASVLIKDRNDTLLAAFIETLIEERPEFAEAIITQKWRGGDDAREAALLGAADVIVAFGGPDALVAIRAHAGPDATFVPFGHRLSIGVLDAAAFAALDVDARRALAEGIARDALLYDGEGCLSLHALFVTGNDHDPATGDSVAAGLAAAFERVAVEFPAGALDAGRAATAAAHRLLLTFRAAQDGVPPPSPMLDFSAPLTAPPALVPRLLPVYVVRDLAAVAAFVERHRLPVQALGIADPADPDVRAFAETIGAVRIARLGTMQAPPLAGRHGGRPRITDFVRWLDAE
jgi:hypothetical protein